MQRIVGVDTARGLAVLGMFVAHLGMERHVGVFTPTGWFFLADGRPSALFATLAGTGLAFMTRRAYPDDIDALRTARGRVVKRSLILFVFGYFLMFLGTPVAVILSAYAVLFLMALPFLRAKPLTLVAWAAFTVVTMPQLVLLGRRAVYGSAEPRYDWPPIEELFSGYYPALSWSTYVLVGLAVGRLALSTYRVQFALLAGGSLIALVGYGSSALLLRVLDAPLGSAAHDLLSTEPHADTTFEILGNLGVALGVLGLCLLLTTAVAPLRMLLTPVSATGSMSLSIYSMQIVYIAILGVDAVWNPHSNWPLIWLVVGTFVFATLWQRFLGQGPLEHALHAMIPPRSAPSAPLHASGASTPANGAPTGPWSAPRPTPSSAGAQYPPVHPMAALHAPLPSTALPEPTSSPLPEPASTALPEPASSPYGAYPAAPPPR